MRRETTDVIVKSKVITYTILAVMAVAGIVALAVSHAAYQRRHAELLQLQAQNQADTVFRSDSLQRSLVSYFNRHRFTPHGLLHRSRLSNDRLLAHYLLGRAYADMGDAPMAIAAYLEAADCADTTSSDCNFAVLRSVYGQMSLLYHYQNLPHEELRALSASEHCQWVMRDTFEALSDYARRMGVYHLMHQPDSLMGILGNASDKFEKYGYGKQLTFYYTYPILSCLENNDYEHAKVLLSEAQLNTSMFIAPNIPAKGYELYYYYLGRIYERQGLLDSASVFYRKALAHGYAEAAYKGLLSVSRTNRQSDSVFKYAELYTSTNDANHNMQRTEDIAQVGKLYNYSRAQEQANSLKRKNHILGISLTFITLVLLAAFLYWRQYRQRISLEREILLEEKIRLNSDYAKVMTKYRQAKQKMELLGDENTILAKETSKTIHALESTISEMKQSAGTDNKLMKIYESPVYARLLNSTVPHKCMVAATDSDFSELDQLIKSVAPHFYQFISSYRLQPLEFKLTLCTALLFSASESAILLGLQSNRITNLRTQVNKKLFNMEGAKSLERNLMKKLL